MALSDARQCTATAKRTGERCKSPAMVGSNVCRLHGGKTPRGLASPNTKHGRYSKDLPTRLSARFEEAINDPQLGNLKSEIALLDTRIAEMINGLDTEQYGDIWRQTHDSFHNLKAAINSKDGKLMAMALNDMDAAIKRGYGDTSTWDSIVRLIEQRRKLTDSERKRQVDLEQMITAERAMLLVSALMGIIKEHVTDKRQLAAISADCRALYVGSPITTG